MLIITSITSVLVSQSNYCRPISRFRMTSIVKIMFVRCDIPYAYTRVVRSITYRTKRLRFRSIAPTLPHVGIKYAALSVFANFTQYVEHRSLICMYPSLEFAVSVKSNFLCRPIYFQHCSSTVPTWIRCVPFFLEFKYYVCIRWCHSSSCCFNSIKCPPASGLTFISTLCCTGWTDLVSGSIK